MSIFTLFFMLVLSGIVPLIVLTWIVGAVAFKERSPQSRALAVTGFAWVILLALTVAISLDSQEMVMGLVVSLPAAILVFLWRRRGYRKQALSEHQFAEDYA